MRHSSKIDLASITKCNSYYKAYRTVDRVRKKGLRSACLPQKYMTAFKNSYAYKNVKLSTTINYPYNLHSIDVILRVIQGVVGTMDTLESSELHVVISKDFVDCLDLLAQWNYMVPLHIYVPVSELAYFKDIIPANTSMHPIASSIGVAYLNKSITQNCAEKVKDFLIDLHDKGYSTALLGKTDKLSRLYSWFDSKLIDKACVEVVHV